MITIYHDPQQNVRFMVPGIGIITSIDPAEVRVEIHQESAYEQWRQWRYEHISMEFQSQTLKVAQWAWDQKRPWWLQSWQV